MIKNLDKMYDEAIEIMNTLGIKVSKISSIRWNYRLRTTYGVCKYDRKSRTFSIDLNPMLNNNDVPWEIAMDTFIHEILHCHPNRMKHTGEWKRCADLINKKYPIYNIQHYATQEEEKIINSVSSRNIKYKYKVICEKCNNEFFYMKEGAVVKSIKYGTGCTCRICGGRNFKLCVL